MCDVKRQMSYSKGVLTVVSCDVLSDLDPSAEVFNTDLFLVTDLASLANLLKPKTLEFYLNIKKCWRYKQERKLLEWQTLCMEIAAR